MNTCKTIRRRAGIIFLGVYTPIFSNNIININRILLIIEIASMSEKAKDWEHIYKYFYICMYLHIMVHLYNRILCSQ